MKIENFKTQCPKCGRYNTETYEHDEYGCGILNKTHSSVPHLHHFCKRCIGIDWITTR